MKGKALLAGSLLISIACFSSGCAVFMAAHQPGKRDLNVLTVGMPRNAVISEFGAPIHTEVENGKKADIFKFTQGYSKGVKAVRAVGHGVADVFTLGLWEVVGTPAEATLSGTEIAVKVTYDSSEKVEEVLYLKRK